MEKGKISALQLAMMMYPAIIATAILLVPAITAHHAKQDMWLSPIWAAFTGAITVWIAIRLHEYYPKQTAIEYSAQIAGKWFGNIIGFVFLFFYLHASGIIVREYGEFIIGNFFIRTPLLFIMGSMILVCAFAVRGGVEVVARLSEVAVPVVIVVIALFVIMLIPDMEIKNMFPIFEHGILPSLKGAIIPQSWFSECFLIAFLLPYVANQQDGKKYALFSVVAICLTLVMVNFTVLFVLGNITARFVYPVMSAVRYISIADFLEHLEAFVMAIWVAGAFLKIAVFYYVLVLSTAQWLRLTDYRLIVFPIGFLILLFGNWAAPNVMELSHFLGTSTPFYLNTVQTVIPLLLLLGAKWRHRGKKA
ncbi:spore germination protein KB [Anoxybacillus voinovskiensis]|uniref:Spore germination protein KB n=1 Tax=Anoxybacteroides voinovskiense TaxID=230470 RepID=A0A840DIZ1_9BACL|nr:endospore germination permease [Anoxybacillus voinovskiensis]MBB4073004.1 spore germination protein KB [Anoxybacillus voinovskiensis]GGJ60182.1 germination protein [Anoxybacillus voinovskiensis]